MANTQSAKKTIGIQERRQRRNAAIRGKIKTIQKDTFSKIASKDVNAEQVVLRAISQIDKARAKGILHRNNAARKKSRLMKKLQLITKK